MRRRMHPASVGAVALSSLRGLLIPLVVLAVAGGGGAGRLVLYGVAGTLLSVGVAVSTWMTTWWSYGDGVVRRERRFLGEAVTEVPFDRVQAIDTVRGPVQRLFGVVELHVQAAGGGRDGEIVLQAVTPAHAEELREAVREGRGAELAAAERPPEDVVEWRLSTRELLVAGLTSGSLGVLVPVVAAATQVLDDVLGPEQAERLVPASVQAAALLAVAVLAAAWLLSFLGTIVAFAGFTATRDGERVRIRRGVIERREASVPVARIHAVRVVESPLREPFGLAQVRIESAGYAAEAAAAQTLLPLVRRSEVPALLERLLPELVASLDGLEPAPPRALRRFVLAPLALGLLAAALPRALFGVDALAALVLPALGAAVGVARHRAAGWRLDPGGAVVLRARRLARTTSVADARRLQHVTGAQTLFQRRAALADVAVAVSSGRTLGVPNLDSETVTDLVGRLARTARGTRTDSASTLNQPS